MRYNQKQVDYFVRARLLRYVFQPFKAYILRLIQAKALYRKQACKLLQHVVKAWRDVAARDHLIRRAAAEKWLEYPRLLVTRPFIAWKQHTMKLKTQATEHKLMVSAYIRWKTKQKLHHIVRTWRHQALYGRIGQSMALMGIP